MTQIINMSYKGFVFGVNPKSVQLELSKSIETAQTPFKHTKTSEITKEPSVIKGSGVFTGEDAAQKAYELGVLFQSDGSAYLFSPVLPPLKAFFSRLKTSAASGEGSVEFEFEFTEDCTSKKRNAPFTYTYAAEGENLFDIANRTGVSVEKIAKINDFKDVFSITEGDKVWLK